MCVPTAPRTLQDKGSSNLDLTPFINAYRGPIIGLIASWGAPWSDAIEIAQDSFSEAWLKRESCRGDWQDQEVFGRWLRGVALNQYRNWARSRGRQQARTIALDTATNEPEAAPSAPETSEHLDALRAAIDRLPANQRQVVLMHYLEESSVNEVATLLATSSKTVEGRLYQARQTLRRLLEKTPAAAQLGRTFLCL